MKTKLPVAITTVDEAKAFLSELYKNDESYHPEDDANDIEWDGDNPPTKQECDQMNKLMDDIYSLKGQEGNLAKVFCPCEFLLMQDPDYVKELEKRVIEDGEA